MRGTCCKHAKSTWFSKIPALNAILPKPPRMVAESIHRMRLLSEKYQCRSSRSQDGGHELPWERNLRCGSERRERKLTSTDLTECEEASAEVQQAVMHLPIGCAGVIVYAVCAC